MKSERAWFQIQSRKLRQAYRVLYLLRTDSRQEPDAVIEH